MRCVRRLRGAAFQRVCGCKKTCVQPHRPRIFGRGGVYDIFRAVRLFLVCNGFSFLQILYDGRRDNRFSAVYEKFLYSTCITDGKIV